MVPCLGLALRRLEDDKRIFFSSFFLFLKTMEAGLNQALDKHGVGWSFLKRHGRALTFRAHHYFLCHIWLATRKGGAALRREILEVHFYMSCQVFA